MPLLGQPLRNSGLIHRPLNILQNKTADTGVIVVSLNCAADSTVFQNCANHQATRLSEILKGRHFAAISHCLPKDLGEYESAVNQVSILLCSCGDENGYLMQWLKEKAAAKKIVASPYLDNAIGDFCLTPIDKNGNAIDLSHELEELLNEIRPRPHFLSLNELHSSDRMIIFPIVGRDRLIVRTILNDGLANQCIMGESIAKNLGQKPPSPRPNIPIRLCGYEFTLVQISFFGSNIVARI